MTCDDDDDSAARRHMPSASALQLPHSTARKEAGGDYIQSKSPQPFMSSYIDSLLIELGFRTRLPRTPRPRPKAEVSPNEQTHPPFNNKGCPTNLDIGKDRGVLEQSSGDAGSLPEPPFFATLPKEMDGRIPGPEGTRPGPRHGTPIDSQTIPVTNGNATGPTVQAEGTLLLSNLGNQQHARQDETMGQQAQLLGTGSGLGADGIGISSGITSNIDEVGHMSLPEDDGMGWLRKKIHAIRDLDLSNDEKARMIHELMTESYNSSRILPPVSPSMLAPMLSSPSITHPASPPSSGTRQRSDPILTSPTFTTSIPRYETQFSLTIDDLQPTYVPKVEPESPAADVGDAADEDPDTEECDEAILGCQHYHRNVKLECHTCKKWYTCRFCHDAVEDHPLIRRDTEHMLCMLCGHAQPAAWNCRNCDEQTAQYYCDICKLWDNDSKKSIYHCYDCGICRIGQGLGKDFFHCKICSVCLPISIEDTHRCIERSTQCDCPICGDYMFTSPETVVVMRCGHSLHSKCLSEYSKTSFRCPICSKTITNMESTFRNLDRTIESQPMPAEFKDTKSLIYCNDCGAKSVVKYHWLGLKCDLCESYNTAQLRVLQGRDISEVLEEEGVGEIASRQRSASLNPDGEPANSLAALHLHTHTDSHRLSAPISTENGQDRRFVSYNMTHGRAISPIVSNYFGLPTERESEKPSSLPFFGGAFRTEGDAEYGALNFLSKKLRDRYGFLAGEATAEAASAVHEDEDDEDEDDGESSDSSDTYEEDKEEEDDDDDGEEYIDLFGHR